MTRYQSAYAWLSQARTPAELVEAEALVASLDLPDAENEKLRGFYEHFAADLSRPDAVERGLIEKIASASGDALATIWFDSQVTLKALDTNARARVWDEIERRMPPKERKWGRAA